MADRQWEELDGSPSLVISKGERYQEIAQAIQRSTGTLKAITDEIDTKSLAMDAIRKLAGDVREDIEKARVRYEETGAALVEYGGALQAAKDEADPAAVRLRTLHQDLVDAQRRERTADAAVEDLPPDATGEQRAEAQRAASTAGAAVGSVQSEITTYEAQWRRGDEAKNGPGGAAAKAISRIQEVVTGSRTHGLEDSGWDRFGEVWDRIYSVVKVICDVAGILAIFFAWVPFVGQLLVVLAAVGAVLAVINAGIDMMRGKGGLKELLLAAGGAVLTLFGGKLISMLGKVAKARMVVQTTDTLAPAVARRTLGHDVIRESIDTVATRNGQRAWQVVKSPFVRGADDAARYTAFKRNPSVSSFLDQLGSASKAAFPNPFTDFRLRALTGNQDVIDMVKLARQDGIVFDGGTRAIAVLAVTGGGLSQIRTLAETGARLDGAIQGQEGIAIGTEVHGLGTSVLDAPWSKVTDGAFKLADSIWDR